MAVKQSSPYSIIIRSNQRLRVVAWFFVVIFVIVIARLFYVQVVRGQDYRAKADNQQSRKFEIAARRGEIYLEEQGTRFPLALNQSLKLVYADPTFISDPSASAKQIAPILGLDTAKVEEKLRAKNTRYVVLAERITSEKAEELNKLKLTGIVAQTKDYRYYPESNLFSHLLGYVNSDGVGQYGLEGYFNDELAGKNGLLKTVTDSYGVPLTDSRNVTAEPKNGVDYVLTIDRTIQTLADQTITEAVKNNKAQSGSIIVMDPRSGKIRALANYPNFDPNNYSQISDYSLFINQATTALYEPGSGFKAITMASGIDAKVVTPTTTYEDTGEVKIAEATIKNAEEKKYGTQSMSDVIQKSLNTGVIFVLKSLGNDTSKITRAAKDKFYGYIEKFGFGVATGIEQEGEAAGKIRTPDGYDVEYANMSFGQGLAVTQIQMINAVAAIANGGKLYQPTLVEKTIDDGKETTNQPRLVRDNVVNPQAAALVTEMMTKVVEGGSGYLTRTPGYRIAGKTGTAQVPRADGKGYEEGKNIGSFVGFAPVEDPRFIILVRVNYPQVEGFAEKTAVPAFATVARELFKYYQIPPSN